MKTPRGWWWGLLFLLLHLLAASSSSSSSPTVNSYETSQQQLRVSVRGHTWHKVPACQHSFGQIELLNLHATDPILIHSIGTRDDSMFRIVGAGAKEIPVTALPHFSVSRLPAGSLQLGPGQVAIVPLTFLARFPFEDTDNKEEQQQQPTTTVMESSIWQQADLVDWIRWDPLGNVPRVRHNKHDLQQQQNEVVYQVNSEIHVETSRGRVSKDLATSTVRVNAYGLPDTIYFSAPPQSSSPSPSLQSETVRHGVWTEGQTVLGAAPSASPTTSRKNQRGVWVVQSQTVYSHNDDDTVTAQQQQQPTSSSSSDCFDVYMKHPKSDSATDDLLITEAVLVSPTASAVLEADAPLWLHVDGSKLQSQSSNLPTRDETVMTVSDWGDNEPLRISSDKKQYVVTVCAKSPHHGDVSRTNSGSNSGNSGSNSVPDLWQDLIQQHLGEQGNDEKASASLGLLQLKIGGDTEQESLLIALEREPASPPATVETAAAPPATFDSVDPGTNDSSIVDEILERSLLLEDDDNRHEDFFRQMGVTVAASSSSLSASPAALDFTFLQTEGSASKRRFSVDVTNHAKDPIRIMRASVALGLSSLFQDTTMGFKVRLVHVSDQLLSRSIGVNETVKDALTVECTVNWSTLLKSTAGGVADGVGGKGVIVVRGTSASHLSFGQYESLVRSNPQVDKDFVLEIPLSLMLIKGRMGVLMQGTSHPFDEFWSKGEPFGPYDTVTTAFYPISSNDIDAVAGEGHEMQTKGIDHHFRVFLDKTVDVVLDEVDVVESLDDDDETLSENSLCNRFQVSLLQGNVNNPFDNDETDADDTYFHDMGLLTIKYRFPTSSNLRKDREMQNRSAAQVYPTTCHLRMSTRPNTGVHTIPLVLYSGQVQVSGNAYSSETTLLTMTDNGGPEELGQSWHRTIVGFDNLVQWFQTTKTGSALRSVLDASMDSIKHPERDGILLGRYIYSLARKSVDLEHSKLRPALLKVGAIENGETETLPLYITNHNPVPVTIAIDVAEVEGMSISLGRDSGQSVGEGNRLFDYLPRGRKRSHSGREPIVRGGPFVGQPLNALRRFVRTDPASSAFLNRFLFRDAISLSESAVSRLPLLNQRFRSFARVQFHTTAVPLRFARNGTAVCDGTEHPPLYGAFEKKRLSSRRMPGPIIISNDSRTVRRLPVCWDKDIDASAEQTTSSDIVLPPGGVARFDIQLRAPPSAVLEKDITQFLATGLVLSTNHGEVIPVFVSFEALQGNLEVSHVPIVQQGVSLEGVVQVPIGLFGRASSAPEASIRVPSGESQSDHSLGVIVPRNVSLGENGVSLFMKSSFSRDVHLRRVSSCNPWFEVVLMDDSAETEPDQFLGMNIGAVSSVVSCDDPLGEATVFPSFFRCALNWLAKRGELQPHGCGMLPFREQGSRMLQSSEFGGIDRAVRALERAVQVSEWTDHVFPTGYAAETIALLSTGAPHLRSRKRMDGVVPEFVVDVMSSAWEAWMTVSELGLKSVATSLRAVVEYNFTAEEKTAIPSGTKSVDDEAHVLSVAIRNLTVESILETPLLLDTAKAKERSLLAELGDEQTPSVVEFPATLVAGVSSIFIPMRNPTSMPVRVRLGVPPSSKKRASNLGPTEDVRHRYLGPFKPPFVQTGRKRRQVAVADADSEWWEEGGVFLLVDNHGDVVRSHQNVTIKSGSGAQFSLLNPSMMFNTAFLVGCGGRCGLREDSVAKKKQQTFTEGLVDLTPTSPIGASAAAGSMLIGRERYAVGEEPDTLHQILLVEAGGSMMTKGEGPSAFALPFSALDEVIIPPFGEVEVGPILFRPPGRTPTLGCAAFMGTKQPPSCESKAFESMIFLENSMTGLERLILRGRTLWEEVAFLDPTPPNGLDEFGDIESRHGFPTLVFSGSVDVHTKGPVTKKFVVENIGDVAVVLSRMYLVESKTGAVVRNVCEADSFRWVDCPRSSGGQPLSLLPGQNKSITIEHRPECTKMRQFVSFVVELERSDGPSEDERQNSASWLPNTVRKSLLPERLVLNVGYEMSESAFDKCQPALGDGSSFVIGLPSSRTSNKSITDICLNVVFAVAGFGLLAVWAVALVIRYRTFQRSSSEFNALLTFSQPKSVSGEPRPSQVGKDWAAAFRCLARVDPTSMDLQTLGRDQTRQDVLARYRKIGALPPQCLNSSGVMLRERTAFMNSATRQGTSSRGPGGTERTRTMSDSIFGMYLAPHEVKSGRLPCQYGWRVAASKGIINSASLQKSNVKLKSEALLLDRSTRLSLSVSDAADQSTQSGDDVSETLHASGDLSSDDDGDDDDLDISGESEFSEDEESEEAEKASSDSAPTVMAPLVSEPTKELITEKRVGGDASSFKTTTETSLGSTTTQSQEAKTEPKTSVTHEATAAASDRSKVTQETPSVISSVTTTEPVRSQPVVAKTKATTPTISSPTLRKTKTAPPVEADLELGKSQVAGKKSDRKKKGEKVDKTKRAKVSTEKKQAALKTSKGSVKVNPWKIKPPASSNNSSRDLSASPPSTLRPPPGLGPPPGFSNSAVPTTLIPQVSGHSLSSTTGGTQEAAAAAAAASIIGTPNRISRSYTPPLTFTQSPLMGAVAASPVESLPLSGPSSPAAGARGISNPAMPELPSLGGLLPPQIDPLSTLSMDEIGHTSMAGFDVMDFLDGILNDGSAGSDTDGDERGAISSVSASTPRVSDNPWASPMSTSGASSTPTASDAYRSSRAAAYGIAVEEGDRLLAEESEQEAGLSLPLLTPAAILSSVQDQNKKDDHTTPSFYATLMGEED